jgi:hypothetical protein
VLQTTAGKMIFGRYIEGPGAQSSVGQVAVPPSGSAAGVVTATGGVSRAQQNAK